MLRPVVFSISSSAGVGAKSHKAAVQTRAALSSRSPLATIFSTPSGRGRCRCAASFHGARLSGVFRQAARMVVKVLRGVKPADIPIEQPTSFELVVNLKTAQAIGHEVPVGLVLRADKVIE